MDGQMTREQSLDLIKMISAPESWEFSTKQTLPDYLYERITEAMDVLEKGGVGMTEREKIIELVKKCEGFVYKDGDAVFDSTEDIEAFYHAAQAEAFEQAAKVCDAIADGWKNNPGNNPLAGYVASHNCGYEIRQLGKGES